MVNLNTGDAGLQNNSGNLLCASKYDVFTGVGGLWADSCSLFSCLREDILSQTGKPTIESSHLSL